MAIVTRGGRETTSTFLRALVLGKYIEKKVKDEELIPLKLSVIGTTWEVFMYFGAWVGGLGKS
jgi:hypothetical protein